MFYYSAVRYRLCEEARIMGTHSRVMVEATGEACGVEHTYGVDVRVNNCTIKF